MNKPLVSIVIICYNGAEYLSSCFDSLLCQTYKNLEVIIVNDGSTDNSLKIMNDYISRFKENGMKFVIHTQKNGGMSAALNSGLKLISGDYFMWCDCDDYYENDAVENLLKYLQLTPNIDIVHGKCRFIDYNSKKVLKIAAPKDTISTDIFDAIMFETDTYCNSGVNMTTTAYLDKCIKNRDIYVNRAGQNWQLLLPFAYYGNFGFLDKVVYNYNIYDSSDSHSSYGIIKQFQKWNNHKLILLNVINSLEAMPVYEKLEYKKRIDKKYKKKKIKYIVQLFNSLFSRTTDKKENNICSCDKCTGCGACASKCVASAIDMIDDGEGFRYPQINKEKCTDCGLCIKTCPVLNEKSMKKEIRAYACYNKNSKERMNSSSGGIFILLAKEIIKNGGVVFGACFDDSFDVVHDYAEKENELAKFMTSKYVQSDLKDSYKKAKGFLEDKRIVYFSGTPCQIEGLLHFLGKSYNNLITQDIICHGVPSPKVWKKYKEYRHIKDGNEPLKINFRNKDDGWNNFNFSMKYNKSSFKAEHNKDLFMQSFLKNTCIRESCYNCSFKTIYRNSDITLGDFWGIERTYPNLDYYGGISAVVVNSDKGKEWFDTISSYVFCKEADFESIYRNNSAYYMSSKKDIERAKFFKHLDSTDFDRLVKRYVGKKQGIIKKVLRKVF